MAPTYFISASDVLNGNVSDEARLIQGDAFHAAFPGGFHFPMQLHKLVVFKAVDAGRVERCLVDQAAQVVVIA